MENVIASILGFLKEIGITYYIEPFEEDGFLPGLKLRDGALIIDADKLLYPGDVLHEAGHLACMPMHIRQGMDGDLEDCDLHRGGEMMAIAWSYAAAIYLKIDPEVVFHEQGYKGGAHQILQNFKSGSAIGLPLLQWSGMSYDIPAAEKIGVPAFPHMVSWLCQK